MRIVLDTNVLLVSVSSRSKHHWLYQALLQQEFQLYITHDILNEYEEKIGEHWHPKVAKSVVRTLLELPNVHQTEIYFHLRLIEKDPDDNKFVNCAFANNCHYLVFNDTDFNVLKSIDFPKIEVMRLEEFKVIFENRK